MMPFWLKFKLFSAKTTIYKKKYTDKAEPGAASRYEDKAFGYQIVIVCGEKLLKDRIKSAFSKSVDFCGKVRYIRNQPDS